jgi:hypothetical protein
MSMLRRVHVAVLVLSFLAPAMVHAQDEGGDGGGDPAPFDLNTFTTEGFQEMVDEAGNNYVNDPFRAPRPLSEPGTPEDAVYSAIEDWTKNPNGEGGEGDGGGGW